MKQFFLSAAIAAALTSTLSAQDATVFIGHGINGTDLALAEELPVDITVNGAVLLAGFEFRSFTDALSLAPGNYSIQIGLADPVNPGSQPALIDVTVPLGVNETATILAHLDDMGNLVASKFGNDTGATGALRGMVQLHHTAWAPGVDIRAQWIYANRATIIEDVTNGAQTVVCAPAGVYGLDLVAANTTSTVLGPIFVAVLPETYTSYYVVGSLSNNTLEIISLSY